MDPLDEYADKMAHPMPSYLIELERETAMTTVNPFMSCGPIVGRLLMQISKWIKPQNIIEIGSFTGYSALCLSEGLDPKGQITCLEINEEYESIIRKYFARAQKSEQLNLIIGDALKTMPLLQGPFDLVWIDASKQDNDKIYELVLPLVAAKGTILVDNVLWYSKVLESMPDKETRAIQAFNEKIKNDNRVRSFFLPVRDGILMMEKV